MFRKLFGLAATLEKDNDGIGYEPSPFSKLLAIDSKTDYTKIDFGKTYDKGDKKVLVICTEQRYMTMENGKKFSSGNHPVELVQPIMHLQNAGFDFDVVTPTGKPACIEMWALPRKDQIVLDFFYNTAKPKLDHPLSLVELMKDTKKLEQYVLFFTPGGQGAMLGLPDDDNLGKLLEYVKKNDHYLMCVCHGPASFLACQADPHPYSGYKLACFPDSIDKQTPMIGYLPGVQTWYYGERLIERGMKIMNTAADDMVVEDRKLLSGSSPKALQKLGKLASERLLETYA